MSTLRTAIATVGAAVALTFAVTGTSHAASHTLPSEAAYNAASNLTNQFLTDSARSPLQTTDENGTTYVDPSGAYKVTVNNEISRVCDSPSKNNLTMCYQPGRYGTWTAARTTGNPDGYAAELVGKQLATLDGELNSAEDIGNLITTTKSKDGDTSRVTILIQAPNPDTGKFLDLDKWTFTSTPSALTVTRSHLDGYDTVTDKFVLKQAGRQPITIPAQ